MNQAFAVGPVDGNVNALASFRVVLTLTQAQAMDFAPGSDIEFSGTVSNTDVLTLATNGDLAESGVFYDLPGATANAGELTITGTPGEIVDIGCKALVTLTNGSAHDIEVSDIRMSTATSGVNLASGVACTGEANTVASLTLDGTDHVLLGGSIIADSGDGVEAGDYSTVTSSDPIVVRVTYQ